MMRSCRRRRSCRNSRHSSRSCAKRPRCRQPRSTANSSLSAGCPASMLRVSAYTSASTSSCGKWRFSVVSTGVVSSTSPWKRSFTTSTRRRLDRSTASAGRKPLLRGEGTIDLFEVFLAQAAGGGLEAQLVGNGVVARHREVAPRGEQLLLRVEHVDVDAHAHLVAELVRVERALRGDQRLLERRDLADAVDHRQVALARVERGREIGRASCREGGW